MGHIEDFFRERADPGLAEKSRHSIWQDADTGAGADQASEACCSAWRLCRYPPGRRGGEAKPIWTEEGS